MPRKKTPVKATLDEVRNYLRRNRERWLRDANITSVGIGYKVTEEKGETDELCIQFTVAKKGDQSVLEAVGIRTTQISPECKLDNGSVIKTDVLERTYGPSYDVLKSYNREAAREAPPDYLIRRTRQDPMMPGISVSNTKGTAGTFGAVVYDRQDGTPYVLSNWHVLHGDDGAIGDPVMQPGPYDRGDPVADVCGHVVRSHVGLDGDCAIATIEDRDFEEDLQGLGIHPEVVARAELGDTVVKSGRTTSVTYGLVERVDVIVKIPYGPRTGTRQVEGFEIKPDPSYPAERGEISMGGDSGSLWLIHKGGDVPDGIAVGLHFAGETDPRPSAEHAIACYVDRVLDKLEVSFIDPSETTLDDDELLAELASDVAALKEAVATLTLKLDQLGRVEQARCRRSEPPHDADECHPVADGNGLSRDAVGLEGLKIYGRWCGPGHGGGHPIDAVDAACKKHDECYGRNGYFNCDCDEAVVRDAYRAAFSPGISAQARAAGLAVANYFGGVQPCVRYARVGGRNVPIGSGHGGVTGGVRGATRGARRTVKKVKRGAKRVWKKIRNLF